VDSASNSWFSALYRPKLSLAFVAGSLALHILCFGIAYQTGVFSTDEVDSIPAKVISMTLLKQSPKKVSPPIMPTVVKKKPKKVVTTRSHLAKKQPINSVPKKKPPAPKKVTIKPTVKPAPVEKTAKIIASPLPSPIGKPSTFVSPQPSYQPKPKYPLVARRRGQEGVVIFEVSVANNGHVNRAMIIQSSGSSALDRAASKAIKTWQFPASQFNSLSTFKQKIVFRLNAY